MIDALLFDLDGTLVDSNGAHVEAWRTAFETSGYRVAADRIRVEIGKGGDHLVGDVLGEDADEKDGDALRSAHDEAFERLAKQNPIAPAPGGVRLLETLRRRGIRLALATSSKEEQIAVVERSSGVAWRELFDVVVSAKEVAESKPSPDIVERAVEKLGRSPAECAMVGDSPWDVESAARAGVTLLAVTYGGSDAKTLLRSGARAVYRDAADLLARLDAALRRASPGSAKLDVPMLERLADAALAEAEEGMGDSELPIGAVVARGDGAIVAGAHDRINATNDLLEHAGIAALHRARNAIPQGSRDLILVSTLEPCVMCTAAAIEGAADVIIYGLRAPLGGGGSRRVVPPETVDRQPPRIVHGVRANESRALFERWLDRYDRNRDQEPYVRELLAARYGERAKAE